jgi:hypothetical protein
MCPKVGPAERVVGVLQRVGARSVPPDHQIGVGAQAGHVVPATDHQIIVLSGMVNRLERCIRSLQRRVIQLTLSFEHRPHGVANGQVDLARFHLPLSSS